MVKVILGAISANEAKMKTFEARYDILETWPRIEGITDSGSTTKCKVHFWKNETLWRIDKESTIPIENKGKNSFLTDSVRSSFDGLKTVLYEVQSRAAKVYSGNVCYSTNNIWLPYRSYVAFGVDLRENLGSAKSIQIVHMDNKDYIEVRFSSGELTACDLTMLLDASNGYCIKKAEIFLPDGTLAGVRYSKSIGSFDGCWVVLEFFEETYRLSELKKGRRVISLKEQVSSEIKSWGETIPLDVFSLEFGHNILVEDLINNREYMTGEEYMTEYEHPPLDRSSIFQRRFLTILLVNLFVIAMFFLLKYLRRKIRR
jgi:hypothetical protein